MNNNNNNTNTPENRSFMFYETYRDCIIAFEKTGDYKTASALAWEIVNYGITGKRKERLENPMAEAAMRSIAPLIDKSVRNGEEALEKIKAADETYLQKLVVEHISND